MAVEEASRISSTTYKITVGLLKILPMVMAGLFLLNTTLSYFDTDWPLITYLAGIGVIPWLFVYAAARLFRFCAYHRMFLWYIMANNLICWTDEEFGLPISNWSFFVLHIIIAGVFLFIILYLRFRVCKHSL